MTNLTDKWNKGKLPEGDYYIKRRNGFLPYDNIDSYGVWRNSIDEDIIEVLAEVPSYEQWQELKEFADYSIHNRDELTRQINFWMQENTKLKELLKRVNEHFKWVDFDDNNYVNYELWGDIKKVLGEE